MSWPDEVMESYSRETCRFELVKIAFDRRLDWGFQFDKDKKTIGKQVVELADAVLAEMEKTPDTGPILADLRAGVQDHLDSQLRRHRCNPTENPAALGFRRGFKEACEFALRWINRAIEREQTSKMEKMTEAGADE